VNAKSKMLNQVDNDFAVIEEQELNSHRCLFQDDLNEIKGTIVQIENPDMIDAKDGGFLPVS
jgi:hypothetical protein